jgi:hypothetical protein
MIKHVWTILCRESKIEAETNNISIIDAYDSIQIGATIDETAMDKTKPLVAPIALEVTSLFFRDEKGKIESFNTMLKVIDPKGVALGEFKVKSEFQEHQNRMRTRMKLDSLPLTTSGTYIFEVYLEGQKDKYHSVSAVPLDVTVTLNSKQL